MSPVAGWALAALALAAGYWTYGWRGVVLGATVVVFWLLLQFSRVLRVMRKAAGKPVGYVASAVMFNSRLKAGLRMIDLVQMTGSLGQRVGETPDVWRWHVGGGDGVTITVAGGRVQRWAIQRLPAPAEDRPGS